VTVVADPKYLKGQNFTYKVGDREITAFVSEEDAAALEQLGKNLAMVEGRRPDDVQVMGGSVFIQCPETNP
jgi:hypothetical protein